MINLPCRACGKSHVVGGPCGPVSAQMDRKTEAIFLLAMLPEGTDVIERVTTRAIEYRDNPPERVRKLLSRIDQEGDEK